MKKMMVFLLIGCMSIGMLFAAGKSESSNTITIEYLTVMRAEEYGREVFNNAAAEYEKLNPGVKIKFSDVSYDDLRTQTLLKAQAGTPPNISEPVVAWIPQLAKSGILEPITNYMSKEDLAKYEQSPINDATIDGVPYAVPFWHGPILLYANTELMKKAGLPDRGPKDIFEFKDWIEKIGKLSPDTIGFSMRNTRTANTGFWFVPWFWSFGGQLVDKDNNPTLNTKEFKDALNFYKWCTENHYSPLGVDASTSRISFAQGRAGFVFDGPWLRGMLRGMTDNPDIDNMYKVFMVPNGVNGEPWTIANPTSLVVLKDAKNKEITFDFIKYLTTSAKISELLAEDMGNFPTNKKYLEEDPRMQSEFFLEFAKQMPFSKGVPWADAKWPGLEEILAKAVSQALSGGDVNVIAKEAQNEFLALIKN